MRRKTMLKFGIAVAAVLVIVVIVYGSLQAEDEFNDDGGDAVATSTPVALLQPTPPPVATTTTDPVVLPGSAFVVQVRGGDNPCRYLYQGNGVSTFAGGEIVLEFVAGTHKGNLEATGEMHLYGDTGPHLFAITNPDGVTILEASVGRGATVYADVMFPHVGLYALYDRKRPDLGQIGEIFARELGTPGYFPLTGWVGECADGVTP